MDAYWNGDTYASIEINGEKCDKFINDKATTFYILDVNWEVLK